MINSDGTFRQSVRVITSGQEQFAWIGRYQQFENLKLRSKVGEITLALFGRKARNSSQFWRNPPFQADPSALYQHGISSFSAQNGKAMISVGWTIWRMAGLHSYQARNFLIDGFRIWRKDPTTTYCARLEFLKDLYDTLEADPDPYDPPDINSARPEEVAPASDHYGMIAWVGAEIITQAEAEGDDETLGVYRERIYRAFIGMNSCFLSARSIKIARSIAATSGQPDPFPTRS